MDVQDNNDSAPDTIEDNDIEQNIPADDNESALNQCKKAQNLLEAISNQDELKLDKEEKDFVYHFLHKAGKQMYGVGAATIYVWATPRLVPIGTWVDPEILSKIPEDEKDLILHPKDAYANVDLVGALWTDRGSARSAKARANQKTTQKTKHKLYWKTLTSVVDDPDQSNSARTEVMYKAGLDKATGIKFDVAGIRGMCVYYAKAGADQKILNDPAVETYLCRCAYMKGAALSVMEARRQAMEVIPDEANDIEQNETDATTSLETPAMIAHDLRVNLRGSVLHKHIVAWLKKTAGAEAQIPRCFSWSESLWTAAGTFVGLLVIAVINRASEVLSQEEHFLVLGPFGALMMLQYGLIGSPAGQPRTVIFGHAIAGSIALGLTYIPEERLAIWLRQVLSVTLANFAMVKLGVACPPASAHSLIYAEGKHDWTFWGLALLGCLISFVPAIFFNNLNPRRQYPSFWGYAPARAYNRFVEATEKNTKAAIQATEATGMQMTKETEEGTKNVAQVTEKTGEKAVDAVKHAIDIPSNSSSDKR